MKEYVAGFLFNTEGFGIDKVALVRKNRPDWQAGRLNAIGGKIEPGETPFQAMQREFAEEAGHFRIDWEQFCTLTGDGWVVYFFRAFTPGVESVVSTYTDEEIVVVPVDLACQPVLPNLHWLVPMALSIDDDAASQFVVGEIYQPKALEAA